MAYPMTRRRFIGGGAALALACGCPAGMAAARDEEVSCSFAGDFKSPSVKAVREPTPEAQMIMTMILDAAGLEQNFTLLEGKFVNDSTALAFRKPGGERLIIYDGKKFRWKDGRASWSDVVIGAHEVGHHINFHLEDSDKTRWEEELEADRFGGFIVSRLGGALDHAVKWYRVVSKEGSRTHPPRAQRMAAVEDGWHHGEAMKAREAPACRADWIGGMFDIDGRQCRIARQCQDGGTSIRVACKGFDGRWHWKG